MLAQSFKSAGDLGINEAEQRALASVLYMLERSEIQHVDSKPAGENGIFMNAYFLEGQDADCGTVACICGWAHKISNGEAFPELTQDHARATDLFSLRLTAETLDLFYIDSLRDHPDSADQIARALRSYLTTGDAKWSEALK